MITKTQNVEISIKTEYEDSHRGYHNRVSTISFTYKDDTKYSADREVEIVELLTGKNGGMNMWWEEVRPPMRQQDWSLYVIKHGYDSGD